MSKTARNVISLGIAAVFSKFIGVITSGLIARFLKPSEYGLWSTLILVLSYAPILCLGSIEAMLIKVPYYTGSGEHQKAARVERVVLASIILSSVVLLVFFLLARALMAGHIEEKFSDLLSWIIIAAAAAFFSAYSYHRFAARQNFASNSIIDSVRAVAALAILGLFTYYWGIKGTAIGIAIVEALVCSVSWLLLSKKQGPTPPDFNFREIPPIVRIGFPITMIWWFIALQSSVDRLVSSAMLGVTLTGYYALGLSFVSILVLLPQVVAKVLYPKVNESIGRGRQNIENLVVAPARIVSLTVPFFLGCLALMLPLIYKRFFPAYLHGLRSCEILLLAAFFLSQLRSGINLLIARSRQNLILIYILSTLAINFLLDVGFVSLGLSIEGLSMGTVISATILCTLIWRAVLSDLGRNRREIISEILHLYFPCILSILIVASIQIVRQAIYHTVNDMYSTVFGETVIFVTSVSLVMLFFGTYRSWMAQYFSLGKVAIRLRKNVTFNEE